MFLISKSFVGLEVSEKDLLKYILCVCSAAGPSQSQTVYRILIADQDILHLAARAQRFSVHRQNLLSTITQLWKAKCHRLKKYF